MLSESQRKKIVSQILGGKEDKKTLSEALGQLPSSYDRWRTQAPEDDTPICATERDLTEFVRENCQTVDDIMSYISDDEMQNFVTEREGLGVQEILEDLISEWGWKDVAEGMGFRTWLTPAERRQRARDNSEPLNETMEKFNYREYVQDNWLLKEAKGPATAADLKGFATKDATLNREKRAERGNWKGSLGKFVEEHGSEIQQAVDSRSLTSYVENTMMPALGPEAQEYLDDLISRSRSDAQLLFGLYNVALKGQGLGLHEQEGDSDEFENNLETFAEGLSDLMWNCNAPVKEDDFSYPDSGEYPYGRIAVKFPDGARFFLGNEDEDGGESPVLAFHDGWVPATEQEAAKYGEELFDSVVTLLDLSEDY